MGGSIGANFHKAMVVTAPREKLLIGRRRPVWNWTQPHFTVFHCENQQQLLPPELHFLTPNMHQIVCWLGLCGSLQRSARPLAVFRGPTYEGRGGEMKKERGDGDLYPRRKKKSRRLRKGACPPKLGPQTSSTRDHLTPLECKKTLQRPGLCPGPCWGWELTAPSPHSWWRARGLAAPLQGPHPRSLASEPKYFSGDVTESMVTTRSPFCGYNTIRCVELNDEDLMCYSKKLNHM